jgi:hypothetical protein
MAAEVETASPMTRAARSRQLLAWAVIAFLSVPPTIVLHELGHYAVAKLFRFPGITLHYGSVEDGADEAGLPAWQRGWKSLAGPAATILLVGASCLAAWRFGPHPLAVAPGFAAGARSVLIGGAFLGWSVTQGRQTNGSFDEALVARHLGLPVELVMGGLTIAVLGGCVYLARTVPARGRWATLAAIGAGVAGGIGFWALVGPSLLP